ncbi:hypothetical protein TsFJ059_007386 [Trichoderma semiorbis]|uniref:Hydrophobic surface binding protein n=1 Tax=Trichoderma semiorbis TaxID=1491008 RepID=A0A9P8KQC9_9HYPO|nr:hypothetical protein TsFJ059_007386 [Trichoderma semiorbis]
MVAITKFLWLALTATAATAAAIVQRDVITVQNDITQKIGPAWTTLNNDINGFPSSGSKGAAAIQSDFTNAIAALDKTTADIKSTGSFGVVSSTTILADIQQLVPTFLSSVATLGAQKASWGNIPDGKASILIQLRSVEASMSKFLDAVFAAEPILLKPSGLAIKAQLTGAFNTAIAIYSA